MPPFQSEAKWEVFVALRLALKERLKGTRQWPILWNQKGNEKQENCSYQINNNVFAKLSPPLSCDFADMHDCLRIISVHMENRGIDNLNKKRTFKSASSDIFRTVVSAVENINLQTLATSVQ